MLEAHVSAPVGEVRLDDRDLAPDVPGLKHERLVVAPCGGRFAPLPPEVFTTEGEWVERDTILAEIENGAGRASVAAGFRGWVMGALALPGQPVVPGQALFWIWES